jgi:hypothetical protein
VILDKMRGSGADLDPHFRVGPLESFLAQILEVLVLLVLVRHLGNVGVVDLQPVLPTITNTYEINFNDKNCFNNDDDNKMISVSLLKFFCVKH